MRRHRPFETEIRIKRVKKPNINIVIEENQPPYSHKGDAEVFIWGEKAARVIREVRIFVIKNASTPWSSFPHRKGFKEKFKGFTIDTTCRITESPENAQKKEIRESLRKGLISRAERLSRPPVISSREYM